MNGVDVRSETAASVERSEGSAELRAQLLELAYASSLKREDLERELGLLARAHGPVVYAELLHLLTHLRFAPEDARAHWDGVIGHHRAMARRLGEAVDLHVALVSYFVEVQRRLQRPAVIELRLFEQTQESVYRDELTGLYNYRAFKRQLQRELAQADASRTTLSVLLIDVDDFKGHNDRLGHEAANNVLVHIAEVLTDHARPVDIVARYGGEEFAWLLPMTSKSEAGVLAEKLRRALAHGTSTRHGATITASIGVATYPADARSAGDLVTCADRSMYDAKCAGKNRVCLHGRSTRSFRRVATTLGGRYRALEGDGHPISATSISDGGVLFFTEVALAVGTLVEIELELTGTDGPVRALGRVVREPRPTGARFETALRLIEIAEADRARLSTFLYGDEASGPSR